MSVVGRGSVTVDFDLLPFRVEKRGVLDWRCWIKGGWWWSGGHWKMGKKNWAPSLVQSPTSSVLCFEIQQEKKIYILISYKISTLCKEKKLISTFLNDHKFNRSDLEELKSASDTCIPTAANICTPAGWVVALTKAAKNCPAGAAARFQAQYSARQ